MKKQLSIQIQNLDLADKFCEDYAYNGDIIYEDSDSKLEYLSLVSKPYNEEELKNVWKAIQHLLKNKALAKVTIVVCQGIQGWDDYHLLHHFDENESLDSLLAHAENGKW